MLVVTDAVELALKLHQVWPMRRHPQDLQIISVRRVSIVMVFIVLSPAEYPLALPSAFCAHACHNLHEGPPWWIWMEKKN